MTKYTPEQRCEKIGVIDKGFCVFDKITNDRIPCIHSSEKIVYEGESFCRIPLENLDANQYRRIYANLRETTMPSFNMKEYKAKYQKKYRALHREEHNLYERERRKLFVESASPEVLKELLAKRRKRYASMTPEQKEADWAKEKQRRERFYKLLSPREQEIVLEKRREYERKKWASSTPEERAEKNASEKERMKKYMESLSPGELEEYRKKLSTQHRYRYWSNPELYRELTRRWYNALTPEKKEEILAKQRISHKQWYESLAEEEYQKLLDRQKKYRKAHPEYYRDLGKKYRREHPEKLKETIERRAHFKRIPIVPHEILPEEIPVHYHHLTDSLIIPIPRETHLAGITSSAEEHRKRTERLIKRYYPGLLESIMKEH